MCHALGESKSLDDYEEDMKQQILAQAKAKSLGRNDKLGTGLAESSPQKLTLDRIEKIEKVLKTKIGNNFDSVRKAFLFFDPDYDGLITIEDFLTNFGDMQLNYNDLKKLIVERDSKKQGTINYEDFSAWFGNSIHQSAGFYFRHDSVRNPAYEAAKEKFTKKNEEN